MPGAVIFYMFNIPMLPPGQEPNPFDRFIIENWQSILIICITITTSTVGIFHILDKVQGMPDKSREGKPLNYPFN